MLVAYYRGLVERSPGYVLFGDGSVEEGEESSQVSDEDEEDDGMKAETPLRIRKSQSWRLLPTGDRTAATHFDPELYLQYPSAEGPFTCLSPHNHQEGGPWKAQFGASLASLAWTCGLRDTIHLFLSSIMQINLSLLVILP